MNALKTEVTYGAADAYTITKTTEHADSGIDRVSYAVQQFDKAGHVTAEINYGAVGSQPSGTGIPSCGNNVQVTTYAYQNGWLSSMTDPRNVATSYIHDNLGRLRAEVRGGGHRFATLREKSVLRLLGRVRPRRCGLMAAPAPGHNPAFALLTL